MDSEQYLYEGSLPEPLPLPPPIPLPPPLATGYMQHVVSRKWGEISHIPPLPPPPETDNLSFHLELNL